MQLVSKRLMSWASIIEPGTLAQAEAAASMPFIFPHLALMPDAHLGKGATVGSVIPTLGAIIPAAVGVDIGCGMQAVRTQYHRDELAGRLSDLRVAIESAVPLSAGRYNRQISATAADRVETLTTLAEKAQFDPATYAGNWTLQLGTLGSGNHFIEVTVDEDGFVWLFLHSGSRGVGNRIASHHIKIAQEAMRRWWITLPDPDLAYLVEGTDEFWRYIRRAAVGPGVRPPQPRGDDGPRHRLLRGVARPDPGAVPGPVPPQLHDPGAALRQGGVGVAQGRHRRLGGHHGSDPRLDG